MAFLPWTYPGPQPGNPALRLAQCITSWCRLRYTDAANTSSRCPNCGMWVAISPDPT